MNKKTKIRYKVFELLRRILVEIISPILIVKAGNRLQFIDFKHMGHKIIYYINEIYRLTKNPFYYSVVDWYPEIILNPSISGLPYSLSFIVGFKTGNPVIRLSNINDGFGAISGSEGLDVQIGLLMDGTVVYGKDYNPLLEEHPRFEPSDFIVKPSEEELDKCRKFISKNKEFIKLLDNFPRYDGSWWQAQLLLEKIIERNNS